MLLLIFIFGLCLGSFLNVLILRLKDDKSILGRSQCPKCLRQLKWFENIPLLSFIFLRAKCASCNQPISWQYPLVEFTSGVLWVTSYFVIASQAKQSLVLATEIATSSASSVLLAMTQNDWLAMFTFGVFVTILLILFVFDFRWYILPDQITIPAIVITIILQLLLGVSIINLLIAGLSGAAWFGAQYFVSKGKWVGDGDIRLGALIGLMLGTWQLLLTTFFIAYIGGAIIAVILLLLGKVKRGAKLPMGAFLTTATIIGLMYGKIIWEWYIGLIW